MQHQNFLYQKKILEVKLPTKKKLELLVTLQQPRMISISPSREMFIGSKLGYVYRLIYPYTEATVLIKLKNYPHSISVRDNYIYIAQTNAIYRAPYKTAQKRLTRENLETVISIPGNYGHNSRTIRFGPDKKLYLSLGISGNCSDQYLNKDYLINDRRGGIMVLDERNKLKPQWDYFASGLRNPVGFDWHPISNIMYASNNGPDHWGFDQPREYFSKITKGSFHGMPWYQMINSKLLKDKCITSDSPRVMSDVVKPVQTFDARNAPMAVSFISSGNTNGKFYGDALVALHGSWAVPERGKFKASNAGRREPKIVLVRFNKNKAYRVDDFVTGFQLSDGSRWARPVGIYNDADGLIYFTSDAGINGLFRIKSYQ